MILQKTLIHFIAILISFTFSSSLFAQFDNYISSEQKQTDLLHYHLKLDLFPNEKILIAEAILSADITANNSNKLILNFYDNLTIDQLSVDEVETKFIRDKNRLIVDIPENASDIINIKIKYRGTPKRAGLSGFVFGKINEQDLIYTINEPIYAPTWFPCDDDPEDKVLLDIEITNENDFVSVSNGAFIDTVSNGNRKTYHWKTFYPISTYLIAVYSSKYLVIEDEYVSSSNDTLDLKYFTLPENFENAKIDFSVHKEMLNAFEEMFGEYPFKKEKYSVAEFLWNFGAMENQTVTGIGTNFVTGKKFFSDILAHELAHHWWGNAVGPKTWKDIWLNESFATYSEALYLENLYGKDALIAEMQRKFSDYFPGTIYAPKDIFSSTVYEKGAWILHMLRWEIGDSSFFSILKSYFEKFKYKNASTEDFKSLCEELIGQNLDKFFDQWIYIGKENINCEYSYLIENDKLYFNLEQKTQDYKYFKFTLPLMIKYFSGKEELIKIPIDSSAIELEMGLKEKFKELIVDPDNWLLARFAEINHTD